MPRVLAPFLFLLTLTLGAQTPAPRLASSSEIEITLYSTQGHFDHEPYNVQLTTTQLCVSREGQRVGGAPQAKTCHPSQPGLARKLAASMLAAGFYKMPNRYPTRTVDGPYAMFTLSIDGVDKTVAIPMDAKGIPSQAAGWQATLKQLADKALDESPTASHP